METTPLVLVELADLDVADLDAMLAAELDEPAAALPGAGDGDELAALLADVLRSTGTAAALAHRLGAHAALLAD
ncbi:hypothetical protein [Geodermatophilus nigrescens]|uniref:FXSXX-COOH protein n=1 Tax=Geodermatophilus nigrescens TaxID=1070870 RepID=A0A1M5JCC8_9ACTN|nr:hypothetical protein [Geodermatophilus nigrescens]SHG38025.1 hypothetical protein SAMN05444351_2427 [Geodermatophilus nigrescens]